MEKDEDISELQMSVEDIRFSLALGHITEAENQAQTLCQLITAHNFNGENDFPYPAFTNDLNQFVRGFHTCARYFTAINLARCVFDVYTRCFSSEDLLNHLHELGQDVASFPNVLQYDQGNRKNFLQKVSLFKAMINATQEVSDVFNITKCAAICFMLTYLAESLNKLEKYKTALIRYAQAMIIFKTMTNLLIENNNMVFFNCLYYYGKTLHKCNYLRKAKNALEEAVKFNEALNLFESSELRSIKLEIYWIKAKLFLWGIFKSKFFPFIFFFFYNFLCVLIIHRIIMGGKSAHAGGLSDNTITKT